MKKLALLIVLLCTCSVRLLAQQEFFGTIDPVDGSFSKIAFIKGVHWIQPQCNTYSQASHRYYFCGAPLAQLSWRLYTIDAQTGVVLDSPLFKQGLTNKDNLFGLVYNDINNTIYGMYWDGENRSQHFVSIDPTTGNYKIVATLPTVYAMSSSPMNDRARQRYVAYGIDTGNLDRLYSIDMTSGAIVASPRFTFKVDQLQLDNQTGMVYGLQSDTIGAGQFIVSVDPLTGVYTKIKALDDVKTHYGGADFFAYDEVGKNYFFVAPDADTIPRLYTVDALSGNVIHSPSFPHIAGNADNVICFQYDNGLNKLFAIHWQTTMDGQNVKIYPNPFKTSSVVFLDKYYDELEALLYSEDGRRVMTYHYRHRSDIPVYREDLKPGNYYLKIFTDGALNGTAKLVVVN